MRVIAKSKITDYCAINKDAETDLEEWYQKTKQAEWTCFADMKKTFIGTHADYDKIEAKNE